MQKFRVLLNIDIDPDLRLDHRFDISLDISLLLQSLLFPLDCFLCLLSRLSDRLPNGLDPLCWLILFLCHLCEGNR